MGEYPNWNRWNSKNRKKRFGSMRFQTGIGTTSEPHGIAKIAGIGTAETAGTAGTAGTTKLFGTGTAGTTGTAGINGLEPLELHGTAYIFNVSTHEYSRFQCGFMQFLPFCSSRTS